MKYTSIEAWFLQWIFQIVQINTTSMQYHSHISLPTWSFQKPFVQTSHTTGLRTPYTQQILMAHNTPNYMIGNVNVVKIMSSYTHKASTAFSCHRKTKHESNVQPNCWNPTAPTNQNSHWRNMYSDYTRSYVLRQAVSGAFIHALQISKIRNRIKLLQKNNTSFSTKNVTYK